MLSVTDDVLMYVSQYEIRTAPREPLYYEMLPNTTELCWSPSCVLVDLLLSEECVIQPPIGATIPRQTVTQG